MSSASVYGLSKKFSEKPEFENPLNIYGYSKLFFDQLVRKQFGNMLKLLDYDILTFMVLESPT